MLEQFLYCNDIDILLAQEVTNGITQHIHGYKSYINTGTTKRGTAIIVKDPLTMTDISTLPSGRGIAALCTGLSIINVYAPSGAEKRQEREHFFNVELAYLLRELKTPMLIGGDFNCVLAPDDCTGRHNFSRALDNLIKGLGLKDVWQRRQHSQIYTYYTYQGAARLDRIYVTDDLYQKKTAATTIFAPFTDHLAAAVRVTLNSPLVRRGKGWWKMNNSLLMERDFKEDLETSMEKWFANPRREGDVNKWWDTYIKKQIKYKFCSRGAELKKDEEAHLHFLHTCVYEAIQSDMDLRSKKETINRCTAEITCIHKRRMAKVNLNTNQHAPQSNERTSLYQLIKAKRRRVTAMIGSVINDEGRLETGMHDIMRVFKENMKRRFTATRIDERCMSDIEKTGGHTLTREQQHTLEEPIRQEEVRRAIFGGQRKKAPGSDGVSLELFQDTWDTMKDTWTRLFHKLFTDGNLTTRQKHGTIVCVPKILTPSRPEDYRPITLLNADYKILARIIAERIKPLTKDLLHRSQYCGRPDVTIHDALDSVRDIIAYTEHRHKPLCILALDFAEAFDRIEHAYLDRMLQRYGFGDHIRRLIRNMYVGAQSSIHINGHTSNPIPIQKSIRQGCPLSMALYALCINPLLQQLAEQLHGVRITPRGTKTAAIAYADDISIFVSDPEDINKIQKALDTYTKASGAKINTKKSKILPLGGWNESLNVLGIQYVDQIKILGITFAKTTEQSRRHTWAEVTGRVRGMASQAYMRDLCLTQRVWYTHTYLLSTLWYTAQVLPPTHEAIRQITAAITRYIWKGTIFRVPVSILYTDPKEGGLGLVDLQSKCRALLVTRLWTQCTRSEGVTLDWLKIWNITGVPANPPNLKAIPSKFEYLQSYVQERAYLPALSREQRPRHTRKKTYDIIRTMDTRTRPAPISRVQRTSPFVDWPTVWRNISQAWIDEPVRSTWYEVANDLIATNARLHKIRIADTDRCQQCGEIDTLHHRLTNCGDTTQIWAWTRARLSWFLRTEQRWIPAEWLWAPTHQIWPPQRHNATSWIVANMIHYLINNRRTISLQDYMDYMRRARWKANQQTKRARMIGNYLEVL